MAVAAVVEVNFLAVVMIALVFPMAIGALGTQMGFDWGAHPNWGMVIGLAYFGFMLKLVSSRNS